jgi:hypothetical protein
VHALLNHCACAALPTTSTSSTACSAMSICALVVEAVLHGTHCSACSGDQLWMSFYYSSMRISCHAATGVLVSIVHTMLRSSTLSRTQSRLVSRYLSSISQHPCTVRSDCVTLILSAAALAPHTLCLLLSDVRRATAPSWCLFNQLKCSKHPAAVPVHKLLLRCF